MKRSVMLVLLTVALGIGLTASTDGVATARPLNLAAKLSHSSRTTIPGETIRISGKALVKGRVVQLQILRSGHWKKSHSERTKAGGAYSFNVKATKNKATYRVIAAKATIKSVRYAAMASKPVAVRALAKPTAKLSLASLPDVLSGTATLRPARPSRPVWIQRLAGTKWVAVATGKQSASGTLSFHVAAPANGAKVRAVTSPAAGVANVASPAVADTSWGKPVWSDEFSGSALSTTWHDRQVGQYTPLRPCAAVQSAGMHPVGSGVAQLKAKKLSGASSSCPDGKFAESMISTQDTKSFTYGYFAARIKFQPQKGSHGGFWLQSSAPAGAQANDPKHNGAEIDVAEYYGNGGTGASVNWWSAGGVQAPVTKTVPVGTVAVTGPIAKKALAPGQTFSSGYHVFSVQWTPTSYVYRVDGIPVFTTTQGVSQHPEFLNLSVLTSAWETKYFTGKPGASTAMSVDWVRVWQH